ncbi:MAG: hypothetical protein Q4E62_05485, partial [Sutterellaceae bacterium]|nr:hypothetical protein [Sutterellaceae bacterium]
MTELDGNLNHAIEVLNEALDRKKEREDKEALEAEILQSLTPVNINVHVPAGAAALPNAFNLSSFFVPLGRGQKRPFVENIPLVHLWNTHQLTYSGYLLDESERDVLMALITIANDVPFGMPFQFRSHQLLRLIYPNAASFGTSDYLWLRKSLDMIFSSRITYERILQDGKKRRLGALKAFHLLTMLHINDSN